MTEIRIVLTEKDFGDLVRGRVVSRGVSPVTFVLADIGWDRMYFQIETAMREAGVTEI